MNIDDAKYQILILGGTGAMGTSLVDILNKQGMFHVVVTSRHLHNDYDNVEYRKGDAHDTEWLEVILQEQIWDAIVDFMVYTTPEFKQRVEMLLDATKQYVFTSSSRVYADAGDQLITEESPRLLDVRKDEEYLKTDEYALAKARQENILIQNERKNWTIIRPYITFSENRLQLGVMEKESWLIPALNNRPIVFSKDIANHYTTMTDGLIVAQCIAAILTNPNAKGEIFHIASNESHKWKEILAWYIDAYKDATGKEPKIHMTEEWDARFGGGMYQWEYDRMYDRRFDNSKICKFVPCDIFASTEDTLKRSIKSFIESYKPTIEDLKLNMELARGELTGDYMPLNQVYGIKRKLKVVMYKLHVYNIIKNVRKLWN